MPTKQRFASDQTNSRSMHWVANNFDEEARNMLLNWTDAELLGDFVHASGQANTRFALSWRKPMSL